MTFNLTVRTIKSLLTSTPQHARQLTLYASSKNLHKPEYHRHAPTIKRTPRPPGPPTLPSLIEDTLSWPPYTAVKRDIDAINWAHKFVKHANNNVNCERVIDSLQPQLTYDFALQPPLLGVAYALRGKNNIPSLLQTHIEQSKLNSFEIWLARIGQENFKPKYCWSDINNIRTQPIGGVAFGSKSTPNGLHRTYTILESQQNTDNPVLLYP